MCAIRRLGIPFSQRVNTEQSQYSGEPMSFTTESNQSVFANPYLAAVDRANEVPAVVSKIKRLSVDDQLALLWYVYTSMGSDVTAAAPGAARLQLAEGLMTQVKQMSFSEQLAFMRDLINNRSTPETRSYGVLSANTKLAFWYQLAEWMRAGIVIPMPSDYISSPEAQKVLIDLKALDKGQQITALRKLVVGMGVDPLSA